ARWFHALSDETRLEIVRLLSHSERCVCELQDAVGAAQSRLSFHLKSLKDAGLVSDRREGRWVYYSLNRHALDAIAAFAAAGVSAAAATPGAPARAGFASLGCGKPTDLAERRAGETVLDPGSGGVIEVLLSARPIGPTGKAYSLNMTDEMLDLARANQRKAGA